MLKNNPQTKGIYLFIWMVLFVFRRAGFSLWEYSK